MKKKSVIALSVALLVGAAATSSRGGLSDMLAAVVGTTPSSCGALDSTSLAEHVSNEVDSRLSAAAASSMSLALFTTRGAGAGSTWTRNPDVWTSAGAPIDWTGASPWNSTGAYHYAGTLVSPRHMAMAAHYAVPNGATVVFVTEDNQIVERTLSSQANVAGTDIQVGILDSAVPETVSFYPVVSAQELRSKLVPVSNATFPDVPMVVFDQEDKALVRRITSVTSSTIGHAVYQSSANATRANFGETLVSGDSGNPGFIVADGTPVLVLTHYGSTSGPNYGGFLSQIDAAMDALSGSDEYDLVEYNLACFDTVGINTAPEWSQSVYAAFDIYESEGPTNPTHTLLATDADGDDVTYSLIDLPTYDNSLQESGALVVADYFTVDSETGVIAPAADAVFDYETIGDYAYLGVKATDSGSPTVASTTYYIEFTILDQEDSPEFGAESYGFSVSAGASVGASVGTVSATDEDAGEVTTFEVLAGNDAGAFAIDASTGAITVADVVALSGLGGQVATLEVLATSTTAAGKFASAILNYATTTVSIGVDAVPAPTVERRRRRGGGGGGGGSSKKAEAAPAPSVTSGANVSTTDATRVAAASSFVTIATHEMTVGSSGEAVRALQKFLNASGFTVAATGVGSPGQESMYFGDLTRAALARWQAANGIAPAVGYLGPKTHAAIATLAGR